MTMIQKWFHCS